MHHKAAMNRFWRHASLCISKLRRSTRDSITLLMISKKRGINSSNTAGGTILRYHRFPPLPSSLQHRPVLLPAASSALLQRLLVITEPNLSHHKCNLVLEMYLSESQVQSDSVGSIDDWKTPHLPDIHTFANLSSITAFKFLGAVALASMMATCRLVPVPSSNHGSVALTPTASISSRQTKELSRSAQGQY